MHWRICNPDQHCTTRHRHHLSSTLSNCGDSGGLRIVGIQCCLATARNSRSDCEYLIVLICKFYESDSTSHNSVNGPRWKDFQSPPLRIHRHRTLIADATSPHDHLWKFLALTLHLVRLWLGRTSIRLARTLGHFRCAHVLYDTVKPGPQSQGSVQSIYCYCID